MTTKASREAAGREETSSQGHDWPAFYSLRGDHGIDLDYKPLRGLAASRDAVLLNPQPNFTSESQTLSASDKGVGAYYVIFNPMASRGGAKRDLAAIERAFRQSGVEHRIVPTERRGHAPELARRAVEEGWPAIVAVGGDGIVHEVVNGLIGAGEEGSRVALGVIPVGSGNDFSKMLRMPAHRPAEAVRRILAAVPRQVDVGRVARHVAGGGPPGVWYFTNGVGVGFDAQVARHARDIQRLRGVAIYAWALVKTLRELRSPRIHVVIDGQTVADRPLVLTTVSNGPCHGGNFWLCPDALIDDGQLDILIADARSVSSLIRLIPSVIRGKHLASAGVELLHGRHVVVTSEEPLPIHADGEVVAEWVREMEIELLPRRLTVLAGDG